MQHEIVKEIDLLDEFGHLIEPGYAKKMLWKYDRKKIKAAGFKIKEWDYYYIGNEKVGVALTIADNSYMSLVSASFLDFENAKFKTTSEMKFFTFGKIKFPSSTLEGNVVYKSKKIDMKFILEDGVRKLSCEYINFDNGTPLIAEFELEPAMEESIVIATPFKDAPKAFYYNQKINPIRAKGTVNYQGKVYEFDRDNTFACLDWGRGVWTYKNTWYWSSLSTEIDGELFGFNLGYGFGDTSKASENSLFYRGKNHKLDQVTFVIPKDKDGKDDFMSPWRITSNDGRIELTFTPILDRKDHTNVGIICSLQDQVFGKFNGRAVLDDGNVIVIKDKIGFAEKVFNKW